MSVYIYAIYKCIHIDVCKNIRLFFFYNFALLYSYSEICIHSLLKSTSPLPQLLPPSVTYMFYIFFVCTYFLVGSLAAKVQFCSAFATSVNFRIRRRYHVGANVKAAFKRTTTLTLPLTLVPTATSSSQLSLPRGCFGLFILLLFIAVLERNSRSCSIYLHD